MTNNAEHLFIYLLAIYIASWWIFAHFYTELSAYWVKGFLYTFWKHISYLMWMYFLPVCGLSFQFFTVIFWSTNVFNFDEAHFIIFFFYGSYFGVTYNNSFPNPRSWRFSPIFSLWFYSFNSTYRSISYFWVNFCIWYELRVLVHFGFSMWIFYFPNTICWKDCCCC